MKSKEQMTKERIERAQQIASDVKNGTYADYRTNTLESWFPMRPVIKKNEQVIAQLYGNNPRAPASID